MWRSHAGLTLTFDRPLLHDQSESGGMGYGSASSADCHRRGPCRGAWIARAATPTTNDCTETTTNADVVGKYNFVPVCAKGFWDPIYGGSCWQCPSGYDGWGDYIRSATAVTFARFALEPTAHQCLQTIVMKGASYHESTVSSHPLAQDLMGLRRTATLGG